MNYRRSMGEKLFDGCNTALMGLVILISVYPMYHILMASLSDSVDLVRYPGFLLWPRSITLNAYTVALADPDTLMGFANTALYVILGTSLNLFMTSTCAFALSRKDVFWTRHVMILIVFTMYFGGGLIPSYLLMRDLGLIDNRLVLILPGAMSAYNMLIMRSAFQAVPESIEESAKIEGAGALRILVQMYLPMTLPTLAVMVIMYGVGHWNSWFSAMIYLNRRELYPIQLILREIIMLNSMDAAQVTTDAGTTSSVGESLKYSMIVLSTLPIALIYPLLQRYFVSGMLLGAVKG